MRPLYLCFGFGLIFGCTSVFSLDDYALDFPTKGVSNYVQIWGMPSLTQFTVCLWMKSDFRGTNMAIFSYAVNGNDNEILIEHSPKNTLRLTINRLTRETSTPANDGKWHHICLSWENTEGSWKFYKDGGLIGKGSSLVKGHVIKSEGSLVLSQEQDTLGGGFDAKQSFAGMLSNVQVWDFVLPGEKIQKMSKSCSCGIETGNVYKWSDFIYGREGKPRVVIPSPCEQ